MYYFIDIMNYQLKNLIPLFFLMIIFCTDGSDEGSPSPGTSRRDYLVITEF